MCRWLLAGCLARVHLGRERRVGREEGGHFPVFAGSRGDLVIPRYRASSAVYVCIPHTSNELSHLQSTFCTGQPPMPMQIQLRRMTDHTSSTPHASTTFSHSGPPPNPPSTAPPPSPDAFTLNNTSSPSPLPLPSLQTTVIPYSSNKPSSSSAKNWSTFQSPNPADWHVRILTVLRARRMKS